MQENSGRQIRREIKRGQLGEKVGEKLGEKVGEKTGEKVGESLGEIHKLNLCHTSHLTHETLQFGIDSVLKIPNKRMP